MQGDKQKLKRFLNELNSGVKTKEEIEDSRIHDQGYEIGYDSGKKEGHLEMMQLIGNLNAKQIETLKQVVRSSYVTGLESR